jgi:hypothetical protein
MIALLRRIVQRLIHPLRRTGTLPAPLARDAESEAWLGYESAHPACRASPGLPGEAEPVSAALLAPRGSPPGWVVVVNAAAGRQQGEAWGADPRHRERRRPSGERAPGERADALEDHDRRRGGPRRRLARRWWRSGRRHLNTVARAAMAAGVAFSAIPQGTFNYFGRCHGFPPIRRRPWRRCWAAACGRCRWAASTGGLPGQCQLRPLPAPAGGPGGLQAAVAQPAGGRRRR